jgi:hypothetical protein
MLFKMLLFLIKLFFKKFILKSLFMDILPIEILNGIIENLDIVDFNKMMLVNKKYNKLCEDILRCRLSKLLRKNDIIVPKSYIDPLNNFTRSLYRHIILYVNLKYSDVFNRGNLIIINIARASRTYIHFKSMKYYNRYFCLIDESVYDSIQSEDLDKAICNTLIANKKIKAYPNLKLRIKEYIQLNTVNYKVNDKTNLMSYYFLLN